MDRDLDDRRATLLVRHIARLYLEFERGHRPLDHLEPHLVRHVYWQLRQPETPRYLGGGPASPGDIGDVRLDRTGEHLYASIPCRQDGDRWGALSLVLDRQQDGRWLISDLRRLHTRTIVPLPSDVPPAEPASLPRRRSRVESERGAVEAAHRAVATRLADAATGRLDCDASTLARLEQDRATWERRLAELHRELNELTTRARIRHSLEPGGASNEDELPKVVARLVGPPPDDDGARHEWGRVVESLLDYRARWAIDDSTALGQMPSSPAQWGERDLVIEHLVEYHKEHGQLARQGPRPAREPAALQR